MKIFLKFILFSIFYFLFSSASMAATVLYFEPPSLVVSTGDEFSVKLFIDSNQPINAYSFEIGYPVDKLEVIGFNNANSIIDVWQDEPRVFREGRIRFIGGSLKPFSGEAGALQAINFKSLAAGEISLGFSGSAAVYLANGKGTKVIPEIKSLKFLIGEAAVDSLTRKIEIADEAPPEVNLVAFVADPITPSQKLLSFRVQDKDSGTQGVFFRARRWLWWGEWRRAVNPTALPKSVWSANLRIIDNGGNVSEQVIYDWGAFLIYVLPLLIITPIFLGLVINKLRHQKRL